MTQKKNKPMSTRSQEDDEGLVVEIDVQFICLFFVIVAILIYLFVFAGFAIAESLKQLLFT